MLALHQDPQSRRRISNPSTKLITDSEPHVARCWTTLPGSSGSQRCARQF